jgi:hypothetical protein
VSRANGRGLPGVPAGLGRLTAMARAVPLAAAVLVLAGSQTGAANARRAACCRPTPARPLTADARTVRGRQGPERQRQSVAGDESKPGDHLLSR